MPFSDEKSTVLEMLGFFWTRVFLDSDFVDKYATTVAVRFQGLGDFVDRLPDYASRQYIPVKEIHDTRLFLFNEGDLDRTAARYGDGNHVYGDGLAYGQQLVDLDEWRYPISAGFDPAFLATSVYFPEVILQSGVDYEVIDDVIHFKQDPMLIPGVMRQATTSEQGEIQYTAILWGFHVEEDIQAVNNFFGVIGGISGDSSDKLKEAMNIAWDLRTEGANIQNVVRLLSYVTDTDFVDKAGKVLDIYPEGDRICVLTDTGVYTAPQEAQVMVNLGDHVQPADIIFDTFVLKTGTEVLDFQDFAGLTLNTGFVEAPHGLFFPNVEVPVEQEHHPDWFDFVDGP